MFLQIIKKMLNSGPTQKKFPQFSVILASDLHGATLCFSKLIGLAIKLKVDAIIVAGDWSGKKAISYNMNNYAYLSSLEKEKFDENLQFERDKGGYIIFSSEGRNDSDLEYKLKTYKLQRMQNWLDYGARETSRLPVKFIAIGGNDDDDLILTVLDEHKWVMNIDCKVASAFGYEFLGFGYSNETPWHTPREMSEENIEKTLNFVAEGITDWNKTICVFHVPPYDSQLDSAPELFIDQNNELRNSGYGMIPVGSKSVRKFVELRQPLAVLSGHCHESAGVVKIGKTTCFNAGSGYSKGLLNAYHVIVQGLEITSYQNYEI